MPSNPQKVRLQHKILDVDIASSVATKLKDSRCLVYVCTSSEASMEIAVNLSTLAGEEVREVLGSRYLEEVFTF